MSSNNTFLTPCRSVGLKRKSIGFTPPVSESVLSSSITPFFSSSKNVSNDEIKSPNTLKSRMQILGSGQTSSFRPQQLISKRFKSSIGYHIPVVSETKLSSPESNNRPSTIETEFYSDSYNVYQSSVPNAFQECSDYDRLYVNDIRLEIEQIRKRISSKKDEIANVQSQSMNAKQHDLRVLNDLTLKWRFGCQKALNELALESNNRNRKCSIFDLLQSIGIPAKLVHYSDTEMDFRE